MRYKIFIEMQPFKVEIIQDNYTTLLDTLTKYQTTPYYIILYYTQEIKKTPHTH